MVQGSSKLVVAGIVLLLAAALVIAFLVWLRRRPLPPSTQAQIAWFLRQARSQAVAAKNKERHVDVDQLLQRIATLQAEAGEVSDASVTIESIHDKTHASVALMCLAKAKADSGDSSGAIQTAKRISVRKDQDWAYAEIVTAQARAQQFEEAFQTVTEISPDPYHRKRSLAFLAGTLARYGNDERAQQTLAIVFGEVAPGDVLHIPYYVAEAGAYDLASELATRIDNSDSQAHALAFVARLQVEAGDSQGARELLHRTLRARTPASWGGLGVLATALAYAGEADEGLRLAEQIGKELVSGGQQDHRADIFLGIAGTLAKRRDVTGARKALDRAEQTQTQLEPAQCIMVLGRMAKAQMSLGDHVGAKDSFTRATKVAERMTFPLLGNAGGAMANAEFLAQAGAFKRAVEGARAMKNESAQCIAVSSIAEAQAWFGDPGGVTAWMSDFPSGAVMANAYLGAAEGLIARHQTWFDRVAHWE